MLKEPGKKKLRATLRELKIVTNIKAEVMIQNTGKKIKNNLDSYKCDK